MSDEAINKTTKELKESISKLSGLLAERFPETNRFDREDYVDDVNRDGKRYKPSFISRYWKEMGAAAVLVILLTIFSWGYFDIGNPFVAKSDGERIAALQLQILQKDAEIKSLTEEIENLKQIHEDSKKSDSEPTPATSPAPTPATPKSSELGPGDNWTIAYRIDIDIPKGDSGFKVSKTYTFNVFQNQKGGKLVEKGAPHNGVWKVNGTGVSNKNKYIVPDNLPIGTELIVTYCVNDKVKLERKVNIVE